MTISTFAEEKKTKKETVLGWIEKGYIPGANLEKDFIPDYARKPYTLAKAKTSKSIYYSILYAAQHLFHVLPALYNLCEDEFNGYIDRLVEAGCLVKRVTDGVTYYDATPKAMCYKKSELLKALSPAISAMSEGVTTAALNFTKKELL